MEIRDLYDENRILTGETIIKGKTYPANRRILVVAIIIQNSKGEFLIQKEVLKKMVNGQQLADIPKLARLV